MMPVDLGQYTPSQNSGKTVGGDRESTGFEDLLAQMQSIQFSALANTGIMQSTVSDGSFGRNTGQAEGHAREARITQETQSARQAEVANHNTRGADPSSVQNGVISERHERVLTQKAIAADGKPAPESKPPTTTSDSPRISDLPQTTLPNKPDARGQKTESSQTTKASSTDQTAPTSDNSTSNLKQRTGGESGHQNANPNGVSARTVAASTTTAAAKVTDNTATKQASPAQRIGQMLAGNTANQVTRATGSELQTQVVREQTSKAETQSQAAKARSNGQAQGRASTDGPEQTKRSEFENLVKSIRMNRGTKSSSATIRLNPPELGKMKIHAQMSDDVLRVRVEATSSMARNLLTERSGELLAALHERGIEVDRFEVVEPESARTDLQDGNGNSSNVPQQTSASDGNGRHTAESNIPNDNEPNEVGADQNGSLQSDVVESIGLDARLDVLV